MCLQGVSLYLWNHCNRVNTIIWRIRLFLWLDNSPIMQCFQYDTHSNQNHLWIFSFSRNLLCSLQNIPTVVSLLGKRHSCNRGIFVLPKWHIYSLFCYRGCSRCDFSNVWGLYQIDFVNFFAIISFNVWICMINN